jgi:hypothetical protein
MNDIMHSTFVNSSNAVFYLYFTSNSVGTMYLVFYNVCNVEPFLRPFEPFIPSVPPDSSSPSRLLNRKKISLPAVGLQGQRACMSLVTEKFPTLSREEELRCHAAVVSHCSL